MFALLDNGTRFVKKERKKTEANVSRRNERNLGHVTVLETRQNPKQVKVVEDG